MRLFPFQRQIGIAQSANLQYCPVSKNLAADGTVKSVIMKSDKPTPKKNGTKPARDAAPATPPGPTAAPGPGAKVPEVPAILLEGDQPPTHPPAGPGQRDAGQRFSAGAERGAFAVGSPCGENAGSGRGAFPRASA